MKLCECGCGLPAPISRTTDASRGYVKGQPCRFVQGHHPLPGGKGDPHKYTVLPNGCWAWWGALDTSGYGTMTPAGCGTVSAHRFQFEIVHGPIAAGLHLHHVCQNRSRVNPEHMELVTLAEHNRRHAKLTMEKACEIRRRYAAGESKRGLGRAFGVDARTVKDLLDGRTWRESC